MWIEVTGFGNVQKGIRILVNMDTVMMVWDDGEHSILDCCYGDHHESLVCTESYEQIKAMILGPAKPKKPTPVLTWIGPPATEMEKMQGLVSTKGDHPVPPATFESQGEPG